MNLHSFCILCLILYSVWIGGLHERQSLNINQFIFDDFLFFRKLIFSKKWVIPFLGKVFIFGTNLTVRMETQFINLRMRLTPNFFNIGLKKLGVSLILKLIG